MKTKILSVLLACLMVLTLVSCGEPETPPAVQEYVDMLNESLIIEATDEAQAKVEAHGTELVIKYKLLVFDSTVDEDKKAIEEYIEQNRAQFDNSFAVIAEGCPEITKIVHSFFDKNDVFVCSITSDDPDFTADDPDFTSDESMSIEEFVNYLNETTEDDSEDIHGEYQVRGNKIAYVIKLLRPSSLSSVEILEKIDESRESLQIRANSTYYLYLNTIPSLESIVYEYYDVNDGLFFTYESVSADEGDLAVLNYVLAHKETVEETSSNDVLTCDFYAMCKSIVYDYLYNDLNDVTDEQKKTLEEGLESSREGLKSVLTTVQSECPAVESMIYTYYSTDGDPIASIEIK